MYRRRSGSNPDGASEPIGNGKSASGHHCDILITIGDRNWRGLFFFYGLL